MAHARQVDRGIPQAAIYGAAALGAALVIASVLVVGMLIPTGARVSVDQELSPLTPAQVDAGREWQRQREQQGGFADPLTEAGREWQRQREQQTAGVSTDPLIEAGREWQRQREQQTAGVGSGVIENDFSTQDYADLHLPAPATPERSGLAPR